MISHDLIISNFLSGYFHEDWEAEASSEREVVQIYLRSKPSEQARKDLVFSLLAIAEENISEAVLFEKYGCYCRPSAAGLAPKDWLNTLAKMVDGLA